MPEGGEGTRSPPPHLLGRVFAGLPAGLFSSCKLLLAVDLLEETQMPSSWTSARSFPPSTPLASQRQDTPVSAREIAREAILEMMLGEGEGGGMVRRDLSRFRKAGVLSDSLLGDSDEIL